MIYVENININSCPKSGTDPSAGENSAVVVSHTAAAVLSSSSSSSLSPCPPLPHFSDEAAFNRNSSHRSTHYNQSGTTSSATSLMPPTINSTHGHGSRSNSLSSVSGESANETDLSCTPSPSGSTSVSNANTLTTFNHSHSQVNAYTISCFINTPTASSLNLISSSL